MIIIHLLGPGKERATVTTPALLGEEGKLIQGMLPADQIDVDIIRTTGYANIATEVIVRKVAQFLKILADETRLQMLWLLLNHRELCVCDIMETLDITQSKASRHLATLRHAGLVVDRREAAWSYYSICSVEDELERAVLEALRTKLGEHPGSVRVLQNLHDWMERKEREATCSAGKKTTAKGLNV